MAKSLTLFEIVLSITLLGILGSAIFYKTGGLIDYYQFEQKAKCLTEQLSFTAYIARCYQSDIQVTLVKSKKGLVLERYSDEQIPLPPFLFKKISLPGIFFEEGDKRIWTFNANGLINFDSELSITSRKKNHRRKIHQVSFLTFEAQLAP